MADDRMRLVAEVVDGFTGPLTRYEGAIRRTGGTAREVSGAMRKDWDGFHGSIGKATGALEAIAGPLRVLGVGSLGVGLSITGMVSALRGFSQNARDVSIMAKETGLAVNQLRAFTRLGEDFGVSAQTMQGGVRKLSDEMDRLRKRYGETYSGLQAMGLGDLVERLIAAPNMEKAIEAAMEGIAQIANPVRRRKVAEMLFGASEFSAVADGVRGKYRETMREIAKDIGDLDAETAKRATEFEKHIGRIGDAAERLKLKVLGPLVRGVVGLIDDADKNGLKGNEQEQDLKGQIDRLGGPGPSARQLLEGRRSSIQQQLELLDRNPSAPDYQRKRDRMVEELKRVGDELQRLRETGGATVQPQSYGGPASGGGLIHKAGFGGGGALGGVPGFGGFGGPLPTYGGGYGVGGGGGAGSLPGGGAAAVAPITGPLSASSTRRGRDAANSSFPGIPDSVPMTAEERNTLGLIMKHESGGRNVMNYMGRSQALDPNTAKGYTAQGYFQMLNSNWRRIAPKLGIETSNAMSSSIEDQTRVALHLLRNGGIRNWSNYNPGLRAALARGDRAPASSIPDLSQPGGAISEGPWFERPRSNEPGRMSRVRDDEIEVPGSGARAGDRLMRRLYGDQAPSARAGLGSGKGTLDITLNGFPAGTKPRASMDDLFKDVKVSTSRQMEMTDL